MLQTDSQHIDIIYKIKQYSLQNCYDYSMQNLCSRKNGNFISNISGLSNSFDSTNIATAYSNRSVRIDHVQSTKATPLEQLLLFN